MDDNKSKSNETTPPSETPFEMESTEDRIRRVSSTCFDSAQLDVERRRHEAALKWEEEVVSHLQRLKVRSRSSKAVSPTSQSPFSPSVDSKQGKTNIETGDLEVPQKETSEPEAIVPLTIGLSGVPNSTTSSIVENDMSAKDAADRLKDQYRQGYIDYNLNSETMYIRPVEDVSDTRATPPPCFVSQRYQTDDLLCVFNRHPRKVLLVKKSNSSTVSLSAVQVCNYLCDKHINVIVEAEVAEELKTMGAQGFSTWRSGVSGSELCPHLDFVIVLGGDGTILWASHLFPGAVPPVLSICMGTLGYMGQFTISDVPSCIETLLENTFYIQLRCRLRAFVLSEDGQKVACYSAMNDCVIDRGECSQLTVLDVYCNSSYFTTVSADGLIIATPTGSTAYSMSAGGSMVHPRVPCILFTPICPHTLSFRPVIIPDSVEIKITNSFSSRGAAWLSIDGMDRTEILRGMSVLISLSAFPVPLIVPSPSEKTDAWLGSLQQILNWNYILKKGVRVDQE